MVTLRSAVHTGVHVGCTSLLENKKLLGVLVFMRLFTRNSFFIICAPVWREGRERERGSNIIISVCLQDYISVKKEASAHHQLPFLPRLV